MTQQQIQQTMSRFKFRIWDSVNEKMIYADEAENDFSEVLAIGLHGEPIVVDSDSFDLGKITAWNVDNNRIIMQSTGKKYPDGRLVYEGDICKFDRKEWGGDDNIHVISWDDDDSEWCYGGGSPNDMEFRTYSGNIYETPELIPTTDA